MHFFLLHCLLLLALSYWATRSLWGECIERLLGTVVLVWSNLVVTALLLSSAHGLGDRGWYFRVSMLIALGTLLVLRRVPVAAATADLGAERLSRRLLLLLGLTILPLFWASVRIAATYEPNNYDSLAYHLPRVMFYLGENSLGHFATGNDRQIYFPFNFNLLQMFPLAYSAPLQTLNFLNLTLWLVAGLAIFRLARQLGFSANAALTAAWFSLTSTQILAQATATTNDLPTGAGLLLVLVYTLRWRVTRLTRDALFAGLAAGLTVGSKLTVIFFGPGAGLVVLWVAWQHFRRGALRDFFLGVRAWILPGLVALALASPFAIINLVEKGQWINTTYDYTLNRPFSLGSVLQTSKAFLVQIFAEPIHRFSFDTKFSAQLNQWGQQTFFPHWNENWAFSPLFLFPPDLNEDHVFFGFAGPLLLLCGVWCLVRGRRLSAPTVWLALVGIGWFAVYFTLNKWSLYNQRYFVLPMLVLAPCLGAWVDAPDRRSLGWLANRLALVAVGGAALWLAGIYLLYNTSRPYDPLWRGNRPPPALPQLPATMVQRLGSQPRINFDSTDGNERAFLFMALGRNQRFNAQARTLPKAYNVYSLWGFGRKVIYSNIEQFSSYTIVKFPTKRTAGVEFLGTIGEGQPALDYYGLSPLPENLPSTPADRNVLVKFLYAKREPGRFADMRVRAAGLNLPDNARLVVGVEYTDGTTATIATFTSSGEQPAPVSKPFTRLSVRIEELNTGVSLGTIDVPIQERTQPPDVESPDDPNQLFIDEFVSRRKNFQTSATGLRDTEGPYPQFQLPVVRWLVSPVLRLEIPNVQHLRRLELTLSARLQARDTGQMDIVVNGQLVRTLQFRNHHGWWDDTIQFPVQPGTNVIELRNVSIGSEPDWLDYLERYPDVKAEVVKRGQPPAEGARNHYELFGKNENRVLHLQRRTERLANDEQLYFLFRTLRLTGYRTP